MSSTLPVGLNLSSSNLTFDDEFDTFTSSPDGSVGYRTTYPYGGAYARTLPANGEQEYYSDSSVGENPFSDTNGVLSITASAAAPGSNPYNLPYDSGLITTQGLLQQEYGYFEVSAKAAAGLGTWSAFWMLPWNNLGGAELDAYEILGSYPTTLYTTTHSVNGNGVHTADEVSNPESVNLTTGFHTYGVDWEPNLITWYFDGQAIATQIPPPGFNTPMYMLLNLAIGGFGGPANAAAYPASMQVDYLHAYATANTILVSGNGAIKTASIAGTAATSAGVLSGVNVDLVDANGNLLATVVTDVNGYFVFSALAAGTYKVLYEAPAGYAPQSGGFADSITGLTASLAVVDGQALSLNPETFVLSTLASVGGTVLKTTGTTPATAISGETVKLYKGTTLVDSTISRSDGTFLFSNLVAGTYSVVYTVRTGEALATGGPANTKTGSTVNLSVLTGQPTTLATQTIMPAPGAVSGTVLYNASGIAGVKTVGLPGATVTLLNLDGFTAATAVTDSNGNYLIGNLLAGEYNVLYNTSAGYVLEGGSAANPITGVSNAAIFVTAGNRTVAATETLTASTSVSTISGTVLYSDGTNAALLAGVNVAVDFNGNSVETAVTDASGTYTFFNLGPGAYQVVFSAPSGDAFQLGGPANFVTGTSATINLVAQQPYQLAPETLIANAPASISGTVLLAPTYTTATGTGLAFTGETISLIGASGLVVSTTTADANGAFQFTNLTPGLYTVRYTLPSGDSFQSGGPASLTTGTTAALSAAASTNIVLGTETVVPLPATITGSVTYNGAAVSYAAIALINAAGTVVATGITNYTGFYTFGGLIAGSYQLRYTAPKAQALQSGPADPVSGLTATVTVTPGSTVTLAPETLMPAPATVAGAVKLTSGLGQGGVSVAAVNSSTGAVVATTLSNPDGSFQITGLAAGSYQLQYTTPAGEVLQTGPANTSTGLTAAFTLSAGQLLTATRVMFTPVSGATLSGTVLASFNGKTTAQAGLVVSLIGSGGTITSTTNSAGAFQFKGLLAGSYQVSYPTPAGDSLQAGGPASTTTGLTAAVTLATGQSLALAAETLFVPPATVSGSVLYAGIGAGVAEAGVAVSLLNAAGTAMATVSTDSNGAFQFAGLAAGSYQISYAAPGGQQLQAGGPADTGTTRTAAFTLIPGQSATLAPETLVPVPAYIAGTVVLVGTGGTTAPEPGVTVTLLSLDSNSNPTVLTTTTTDSNGVFQFVGLAAANYEIRYTTPTGQALQGGPASAVTGTTAPIALGATQYDILGAETLVIATASLSGMVVLAGAGQAGVAVTLMNAAGTTVGTATTDSTGTFQFSGLPAGSYTVDYTAPAGDALLAGGPANTATGLTGAYTLTNGQALTLPSQGLSVLSPGISGTVVHVGSGDPGTGQGGITVSLLNTAGTVLRTAVTTGSGAFSFKSVAAGTYALRYSVPTGESVQAGGAANATTGTTAPFTYATGQGLVLAAQNLVSTSNSFVMTGPSAAAVRGDGSYTVTGNASNGNLQLGAGNQSVTLTGFIDTVVLGAGNQSVTLAGSMNNVTVGDGTQTINAGNGYETVRLGATPAGTTSTVQMTGLGDKVVATGDGNVSVSGPAGSAVVTLGNGNQSVTLTGSSNTVTIGAGTSTVTAGQNNNIIHAGGGSDTISVTGQGNLLDAGPGMNFYNGLSGSRLDTFMLNGSGQGLTTIAGFNTSDTLDLARTVAGLGVLNDFSNLGHFVTSSVSNGSTTLFVDPTGGGGSPYAFATLSNVSTSVAQLIGSHNFSLT